MPRNTDGRLCLTPSVHGWRGRAPHLINGAAKHQINVLVGDHLVLTPALMYATSLAFHSSYARWSPQYQMGFGMPLNSSPLLVRFLSHFLPRTSPAKVSVNRCCKHVEMSSACDCCCANTLRKRCQHRARSGHGGWKSAEVVDGWFYILRPCEVRSVRCFPFPCN